MGGFEDCGELRGELVVSYNRGITARGLLNMFDYKDMWDLVKHWVSDSPPGSLQSRHMGVEPGNPRGHVRQVILIIGQV